MNNYKQLKVFSEFFGLLRDKGIRIMNIQAKSEAHPVYMHSPSSTSPARVDTKHVTVIDLQLISTGSEFDGQLYDALRTFQENT